MARVRHRSRRHPDRRHTARHVAAGQSGLRYLLPPRNLSKPLGRFSWDGSNSPPCWPKEAPVGTVLGPAARRASASLSSCAALAGLPERAFFFGALLAPLRAPPP